MLFQKCYLPYAKLSFSDIQILSNVMQHKGIKYLTLKLVCGLCTVLLLWRLLSVSFTTMVRNFQTVIDTEFFATEVNICN